MMVCKQMHICKGDGAELLILDVNLPGMEGVEILKNLRRRRDNRPV